MLNSLLRFNLLLSSSLAAALLLFTASSLAFYGVAEEAHLVFMTRLYGGAHLVFALLIWQALRADQAQLRQALVLSLCVGDSLATGLALAAQRDDLINAYGWANVGLQSLFAVGYGCALLPRRR